MIYMHRYNTSTVAKVRTDYLHFANNLELLNDEGKYNYVAYLLSDVNSTSIKLAKYSGEDRCDLIENNELECLKTRCSDIPDLVNEQLLEVCK